MGTRDWKRAKRNRKQEREIFENARAKAKRDRKSIQGRDELQTKRVR